MLLKCSVREDSWESLWLQEDQTSQHQRKSTLSIHWKDWSWSWSSNPLVTWCEELTHWKRPWCWERLRAWGEGEVTEDEKAWMASLTQWTWIWASTWEIVKNREAWCATVHEGTKSQTQICDLITRHLKRNFLNMVTLRFLSKHAFQETSCYTQRYIYNMYMYIYIYYTHVYVYIYIHTQKYMYIHIYFLFCLKMGGILWHLNWVMSLVDG